MGEFDVEKLVCYGCCHSAGDVEYPGMPSGERPCHFCLRNKDRKDPPVTNCWYDGSAPVKIPMDCYHPIDMLDQMAAWEKQFEKSTKEEKK